MLLNIEFKYAACNSRIFTTIIQLLKKIYKIKIKFF